jgi:large repetitive protein
MFGPVNGTAGDSNVGNAFTNDLLNGQPVNPVDITGAILIPAIPLTPGAPVPVMDPNTGIVSVPAGTPAGSYTIQYQICEILNPSNCDVATLTVNVDPALILAVDDMGTLVNGYLGGTSYTNVLVNDELNGSPVNPADITLSFISSTHPGITLAGTDVVVAPGTPAGTYTLTYQICEILNPTNCDQAEVTVPVGAPVIVANDDAGIPVNGLSGGLSMINVLTNDMLNGSLVIPSQVNTAFVSSTHPGIILSGTNVLVAPGTPAGNYTLTYEICEILNPTNCDQAVVTVPVTGSSIVAVTDYGVPVLSTTGGTSVANIHVNDTLNGVLLDPTLVNTVVLSSSHPGVTLVGGSVVVAPGTPIGYYTLIYQISEIGNSLNRDTAIVYVPVVPPGILANVDYGTPVVGQVGGVSVADVLVNDLLDAIPVNPVDVTVTYISSNNAGVTMSGNSVLVAPGTPVGSYQLIYRICEILNPANCDTAIVKVPVTIQTIVANDDAGMTVNSFTGGTALVNVLVNDSLGIIPVVASQVHTTFISSTHPGITLVGTDVVVAPGTPAGLYTLTYNICEIAVPTNCDQATVTVPIVPTVIVANDDLGTTVNGYTGGTSFTNVLVNDELNGAPVNPADISLSFIASTHPGITLNGTNVDVAPGTPAGNYTLTYQICEIVNPSNCDQATVTVPVVPTVILANDDAGTTVNSYTGGTAFTNVLVNDELNGAPVNPLEVNTSFVSSTHPGITLNGTDVEVAAGTPAGNYTLTYQICEILNPTNCDLAVVTVPIVPTVIIANDDAGTTVNSYTGGTAFTNVLVNDELNGAPVNPLEVNTSFVTSTHPGITLNGTDVVVAAGTPAGNYTLTYQICEILNPSNCDQATVTVPIVPTVIVANDDAGTTVNGYTGGTAFTNVLVNDELNGAPVNPAQVTTSFITSTHPGITLNGTDVVVAPGTPAGNYTLTYQICEILNPSNCDQAVVTVPVMAPVIVANDDQGAAVNGFTGGTSFSYVPVNDLLNGNLVVPSQISITQVSSTHPGISLNGYNTVVAPGTPAGTYYLTYQICEIVNPTNCDIAVVTVPVVPTAIIANDDAGTTVNSYNGGTSFTNVLANDLLNGAPVNPAQVTTTFITSTHPGITLNGTDVVVAAGTPAGNYTLTYQICEILNPTNCDIAVVTVPIVPTLIVANDDTGTPVNSYTGGTSFTNVLTNDLLNGAPVNPADINLSFITSTHPGITLNGSNVEVAPGTPAGTYTLTYQICEIANPTNCDQADVTVTVTAPAIIANDDAGTPVGSFTGGVAFANVLVNDTLNGAVVNPADVMLTFITSTHPGIGLNGTAVEVAPGTPAGTYTLSYQICEIVNPSNCDQAVVSVNVFAQFAPIEAVVDYGTPVQTQFGGVGVADVLINDQINGVAVNGSQVSITQISATWPGITMLGGAVLVPAGTPTGAHTLIYRICDLANPTVCDTAIVYLSVVNTSLIANVDYGTAVNGSVGGYSVVDVLWNDSLNGQPVNPASVNITLMYTPNAGINMFGNGVLVSAGTPAGIYNLVYRLCEIANPLNCDTALVVVTVNAPAIEAVADYGATVNGLAGGVSVGNVLVNDLLNGQPVNSSQLNTTYIASTHPNITLNGTVVEVAPGTPAGNYTLTYQICEILNPANCDTAIVYVPVVQLVNQFCLTPKVFLQGPFDVSSGLMHDSLRDKGFIPASEPYSGAPYNSTFTHIGTGGGETIANPAAVFGVTGNNAIVDWVFVELRDRNNMTNVVLTRSALLQRDGDVVDVDGVSPLCFTGLGDSLYYVSIRHRNHLGVMTASPKLLTPAITVVDFRYGAEPEFDHGTTLGNGFNYTGMAQKQLTIGTRGMWAGDVNRDGRVKYQGNTSDRTAILNDMLAQPGNINQEYNYDFGFGYNPGDINMDAKVKYQGGQADRTLLLNYLLNYPINTQLEYNFDFFLEQLP